MPLLEQGQIVRGTYEVERLLGEGAFAEVYRVRHRFLGRQAMKVLKVVGMTADEIEELLGEAILLSRISHPNIIKVFDANVVETPKGMYGFFTMEYVAGGNLEQYWKSHGARLVPIDCAVDLMRQVSRGLCVAHSESPPVIHRDIKPQNILVGHESDGLRARLCDFGLAKRVNPMTLMASTRGAGAFKAPEALKDPGSDSAAADVWAVGATLYLLLTDRLPYSDAPGSSDFVVASPGDTLTLPSRYNIGCDARLDAIVARALEIEPRDRYRDARGLLADLETWEPRSARAVGGDAEAKAATDEETAKRALGSSGTSADEKEARSMVQEALKMARHAGHLAEAADLMEEAFKKWPGLRERYESHLRLWRNGICSAVGPGRPSGPSGEGGDGGR